MENILDEIRKERERQRSPKVHSVDIDEFDKSNSQNDWVAYISAYSGRAADKVDRNRRENQTFRENMIKVATLAVAALEAHDKGYC